MALPLLLANILGGIGQGVGAAGQAVAGARKEAEAKAQREEDRTLRAQALGLQERGITAQEKASALNEELTRYKMGEEVRTLARGDTLPLNRCDHQLTGELKQYRECHVKNDILLVYQKHEDILVLLLVDLGTHEDLFR